MAERLEIRMPALSATMEEGEIVRWTVEVGDTVRSGQPIAEVVTDKVDMELESPYDGVVAELTATAGASVRVGQPVALLTTDADDLLAGLDLDPSPTAAAPPAAAPPAAVPTTGGGIVPAPPPVRKRARELGIDLAEVTPTGGRGQVTHADLDAHQSAPAQPVEEPRRHDRRAAVQAATARLMTASALVPQFVLHRRVDLSRAQERKQGRSWTTEIARALDAALRAVPELCARWDGDAEQPVPVPAPRVGLAVESEHGLVVVGLDPLADLTPDEADHHVRDTIRRARTGRLRPDDRTGLTSTLSNLGSYGIDSFDALVMPPQASILSAGRITDVPAVVDGHLRPLRSVALGLTVDHRVANGTDGARLLAAIADQLEA